MGGLGGLSGIIVLWLGTLHVVQETMTLGGFIAFLSYLGLLTGPTIMMGWMIGVFQRGLGAIRRIEEIHAESSDLPGDRIKHSEAAINGGIMIRDLRFTYPGSERPALDGIGLDVEPGMTIGIVGRVGSGKSTLVHLLAAVHPVPNGSILIDGRDINSLPTPHLRARIGIVPQETFLFSRTIADNIALGRPGCERRRIEEVSRIACLDRDLERFPHGLDTMVGERGVTLSGGQRQRVALARALLIDPRILILDDALSSVDADTERAILGGLQEFMRNRTTLIVSHRISTVLGSDRIVVLEDGRLLEFGTVADLASREGAFFQMMRQQQIENELEVL